MLLSVSSSCLHFHSVGVTDALRPSYVVYKVKSKTLPMLGSHSTHGAPFLGDFLTLHT